MKKVISLLLLITVITSLYSQKYYWVCFKDKQDTEFNPYTYFDDKAIERRLKNNISLYDKSDFPINKEYKNTVVNLTSEYVGETRWFNAIAVQANETAIEQIKSLEFVKEIIPIISEAQICNLEVEKDNFLEDFNKTYEYGILPQLRAMEGEEFVKNNIDGKGIRVAVFDGGFPDVNNHPAFEHLRKNNQILKTYNFPKKKENVYGWNSHGTMVLGCIAGIDQYGNKMGLATGSEFILARTEINTEPAKEEVYWMMAVEWADKNGANVINSSLGYGSDRHSPKDMDGKTCLVTRAANMAASKGILVCNSMGNEGDKINWQTLGAPADADSILTVGGVRPSTGYHISFSSYGPTADGRMKPNVSAFGNARVPKPGSKFGGASGTSFSSPLVAGFVACAWQTDKSLSAMELKDKIEKSANLYPYYDYAVGYGVPQAGFFTNKNKIQKDKTFEIIEQDNKFVIRLLGREGYEKVPMYYHIENAKGELEYYTQKEFSMGSGNEIVIDKYILEGGKTLRVFCNGYIAKIKTDDVKTTDENIVYKNFIETNRQRNIYSKDIKNNKVPNFGVNAKFYLIPYFSRGFILSPVKGVPYDMIYGKSGTSSIGLKYIQNLTKWYRIGLDFEYNSYNYFYKEKPLPNIRKTKTRFEVSSLDLEFFQRFRLIPGSLSGFGTYLDLGVYGSMMLSFKESRYYKFSYHSTYSYNYDCFIDNKWNWGVKANLGFGIFSIYAKYRFPDFNTRVINGLSFNLYKLEAGLEMDLPLFGLR